MTPYAIIFYISCSPNQIKISTDSATEISTNMDIDGDLSGHGQVSGQLLLPVTLNGTDGSSSDAGDNLVLEGTDSGGANANDNILFEGAFNIKW